LPIVPACLFRIADQNLRVNQPLEQTHVLLGDAAKADDYGKLISLEQVGVELNRRDSQRERSVIHPLGREDAGEDGAWRGSSDSGDQGGR
jgi:hypothetical protein